MGNLKAGKDGKNLIVRVPRGVVVWKIEELHKDEETMMNEEAMMSVEYEETMIGVESEEEVEYEKEVEMMADLDTANSYVVLCKGGRGGKGNGSISTSERHSINYATPQVGESYKI